MPKQHNNITSNWLMRQHPGQKIMIILEKLLEMHLVIGILLFNFLFLKKMNNLLNGIIGSH